MRHLQTLTIPEYITKIKTSDGIRPTYYSKYDSAGKGPFTYDDLGGERYDPIRQDFDGPPYELPAPKTKLIKVYEGKYQWNSQGYLEDKDTGERLISNPRRANKPSYESMSGNKFISDTVPGRQAMLKNGLKDFYRPFVEDQLTPIEEFPIYIRWEIHTPPDRNGNYFDLSNLFFYRKYLEDVLFEVDPPIVPDDNIKYITHHEKCIIPVDEWEDRKFVFEFYTDNRQEINDSDFWN